MSKYKSIVVLTGAGISAESGIQTFRDSDGLWQNHRIEDVASPDGFRRNPQMVQEFYNARRQQLLSGEVKENAAHVALGQFERDFTGSLLLVTQNVDDLHERGGSNNLAHIHGELLKKRCTSTCLVTVERGNISENSVCQCCDRTGTLRPHIVWFGEMPFEMERIEDALRECDLFVSIGTSGNVYPAAGFVDVANRCGARTVTLNLEPSANGTAFQHGKFGKATDVVPEFFQSVLSEC